MSGEILYVKNLSFLDKGPYTFKVFDCDRIGLSGLSGIGKTQLFRALVDLIPFKGDIFCKGVIHSDVAAPRWRSMITLVLAESFWWHDTVGDHFDPQRKNDIELSLEQLGLAAEVLNWTVMRLSLGERQRLSLLRSLQNKPTILLLDEPTASLDQYHTMLVERFIDEYCKINSIPLIWISHDEEQLDRVASRRFTMQPNSLLEIA